MNVLLAASVFADTLGVIAFILFADALRRLATVWSVYRAVERTGTRTRPAPARTIGEALRLPFETDDASQRRYRISIVGFTVEMLLAMICGAIATLS